VHNERRQEVAVADGQSGAEDAFVLDLLERRTFRRGDFAETDDGQCRILAPLTHELAEMMPTWAEALAPVAERVAHTLGRAMAGKYVPVTPLTTDRHRRAQAVVKARKATSKAVAASTATRQRASKKLASAAWSCPDCGRQVTNHRHVRCDSCIAADPRQTPELRGRRGAAIAARKQMQRAISGAAEPPDPDYFRREILPRLAGVKLTDIMEATGISKAFASQVRSGRFTPHVSTWAALAELAKT
jgi:hypothetical protein